MSIVTQIAEQFGLHEKFINQIVRTASHLYKIYTIPKRSGGVRVIHHPSRELKFVQRWIVGNILNNLPIHSAATAYIKGLSIRDNALRHASGRYILRVDLENFFPSISRNDILVLLEKHSANHPGFVESSDIPIICDVVTRHGKLTIGAPSSPVVSNAIMYDTDVALSAIASAKLISYSRYADDIYFSTSTPNTLKPLLMEVRSLITNINSPPLKINEGKILSMSRKERIMITGLVITPSEDVSLGRKKKREIRTMVFKALHGTLRDDELDYLRGYLAYSKSVEPNFINRLNSKYGQEAVSRILSIE